MCVIVFPDHRSVVPAVFALKYNVAYGSVQFDAKSIRVMLIVTDGIRTEYYELQDIVGQLNINLWGDGVYNLDLVIRDNGVRIHKRHRIQVISQSDYVFKTTEQELIELSNCSDRVLSLLAKRICEVVDLDKHEKIRKTFSGVPSPWRKYFHLSRRIQKQSKIINELGIGNDKCSKTILPKSVKKLH